MEDMVQLNGRKRKANLEEGEEKQIRNGEQKDDLYIELEIT